MAESTRTGACPGEVLPLSLEQVAAVRPWALETWKYLVIYPMGTAIDETALARALAFVAGRHQPLRLRLMSLPPRPGEAAGREPRMGQRFTPPAAEFTFDTVWCPDQESADREADTFIDRELNLFEDGPLRVRLLRVAGGEAQLLLAVHHLAWDGGSRIPFKRDLQAAYLAFATGTEPQLPALRSSYSEHVIAQQRAGEQLTGAQIGYWDETFRGWDAAQDPGAAPLPPDTGPWSACLAGPPPDEQLQARIQRAARAMRVTPAAAWLAAVLVALWAQHDQDYACAYWVHHGRDRGALVDLVGFFNRSIPVRVRMDPQQRFDRLCAAVFAQITLAIRHSMAPWSIQRLGDHVMGVHKKSRGVAPPRLARVTVNIHTFDDPGQQAGSRESGPGLATVPASLPEPTPRPRQLWLELFLGRRPLVFAEYDQRIFPDRLARTYLGGLSAVVRAVAESGPQLTLRELRNLARQP
jgi:hypothetical protein